MKLLLELVALGFNGAVIAMGVISYRLAATAMRDPTAKKLQIVQKYLTLTIVMSCILLAAQLIPVLQASLASQKPPASIIGDENQGVSVGGDNHSPINQSR